MESSGWWFNWTDSSVFKPPTYKYFAPQGSYWGYAIHGSGAISLRVKGQGTLTLDFGNLLGSPGSEVAVYLNLEKKATAGPSEISKVVDIPFKNADALIIAQIRMGIIVLNSISFQCAETDDPSSAATAEAAAAAAAGASQLPAFVLEGKRQNAGLQQATGGGEETGAAGTLEQAAQNVSGGDGEELQVNNQMVQALMGILASEGQPAGAGAAGGGGLQQVSASQQSILAASAGERSGDALLGGEGGLGLHEATLSSEDTHAAVSGLRAEGSQFGRSANSSDGTNSLALARAQRAEERLSKQQLSTVEAAERIAEGGAVGPDGGGAAQRLVAMEMPHSAPALPAPPQRPSLYCFALMLPFGAEPVLLERQKKRNVGLFSCDEHTIFSNSTSLVDTGQPLPVDAQMLGFSLSVPYGGKWHTALNTPIFNKIWTKVRDMGIYLNHAWSVKVDPDTVWFPERLRKVLSDGIPAGAMSQRRLQAPTGCRHCKLEGAWGDECGQHVKWLQKNENKTCAQALQLIKRPPPLDCGCDCMPVEACDLRLDPDWRRDHRYIKGDVASERPAVYINNCHFGLHGPIEVLSTGAVTTYVLGLPKCEFLRGHQWGEDKYLDRCMLALGVTRVNAFSVLSETACGEEPVPCRGDDVAYHPFKQPEEFFKCWDSANAADAGQPASGSEYGFK